MQPIYDLLLGGQIRLSLGHLRYQPTRVQAREQLATFDVISLLRQDLSDAFAAVERQLDLSEIDIAVDSQLSGTCAASERPPKDRPESDAANNQNTPLQNLWHPITPLRRLLNREKLKRILPSLNLAGDLAPHSRAICSTCRKTANYNELSKEISGLPLKLTSNRLRG
jgi:hypothetical protein